MGLCARSVALPPGNVAVAPPPSGAARAVAVVVGCKRPLAPCRRSCCLAPALQPRLRAAAGGAGAVEAAGARAEGCAPASVEARRDECGTALGAAVPDSVPVRAPAKSPARYTVNPVSMPRVTPKPTLYA